MRITVIIGFASSERKLEMKIDADEIEAMTEDQIAEAFFHPTAAIMKNVVHEAKMADFT